ncbi:MAG: hypothetical protein ACHQUB_00115 [Candidatus Saccharimonadia bacterium]
MKTWTKAWWQYSLGLFLAWIIVFLLVWKLDTKVQLKDVSLIFYGYFVGWLSGTIKMYLIHKNRNVI